MIESDIKYYITIGGLGTRMKYLSPIDKHLLYWKDKRIITWIREIIPSAKIIGKEKTNNRRETLLEIAREKNVCIVDCDIIPFGLENMSFYENTVVCFKSRKEKYGSLQLVDNRILNTRESENISNIKCSGVYFVEDMTKLLDNMIDYNSIVSGMIGSYVLFEKTFIKLGDPQDYFESL